MRKISRAPAALAVAGCLSFSFASAVSATNRNYIVHQNHTGLSLPGVSAPSGFDEIRASDGTTCRSAMSGSGAFVDTGVVGGGLNGRSSTLSAYGRIVVPLGERPARLDCNQLYQLELRRLQLEVKMLERGLDPRMSGSAPEGAEWAQDEQWKRGGGR